MARLHRVLATLTLLVAATALCAAPALARKRDHDKLPDRWERKFHLSTKKNDGNRDRDRDGLSNNDGTKDGKANAGKITALTGSSITIRLAAGGKLNAGLAGGQTCDASSLKRGSLVHEATVDRSGPSPVVTAAKLVRR